MDAFSRREALALPGICLDPDRLLRLRHLRSHWRASASRRLAQMPGQIASSRRGHGVEIDDIRMWLPGDDTRHLDRNATARTAVPHVRSLRDERQTAALLVADFRCSMLFGTRRAFRSVAGAEALAIVGWRVVEQGGRVGLLAIGSAEPALVRMAQGYRTMSAAIAGMARAHRKALEASDDHEPALDTFLEMAARCLPHGGSLVVATALENAGEGFDRIARSLAPRSALRIILVRDPFEHAAPPGWYPFASKDGRRGLGAVNRRRGTFQAEPRLARLQDLGARVVRLESELAPESNASLLVKLDALGI